MAKLDKDLKAAGYDAGRSDLITAPPEAFSHVTDPESPLYEGRRLTEPLSEDMVLDIMENGVRDPIKVIRDGVNDDNTPRVLIVAGNRRKRHVEEANRRLAEKGCPPHNLKAEVMRCSLADAVLISAATNLHRKDEAMSGKARKIQQALKLGKSEEQVRTACGLSKYQLDQVLTFLELAPEAQDAIDSGKLGQVAIPELAKEQRSNQPALVKRLIAEGLHKAHEIQEARQAIREGREVKKTRKRAWGRKEMRALDEVLAKIERPTRDVQAARFLIDWMLNGGNDNHQAVPVLWGAIQKTTRQLNKKVKAKS